MIDAIRLGIWDFEPEETEERDYAKTDAMPGSDEKLSVLAERLEAGEPLWHPADRQTFKDDDKD